MRSAAVLLAAVLLAGCTGALDPSGPDGGSADGDAPVSVTAEPVVTVVSNPTRDRETDVAFHPDDPSHVVVLFGGRPREQTVGGLGEPMLPGFITIELASSHDGGATWTVRPLPITGEADPSSRWSLFCAMGDPNVFFDPEGTLHVVTIALTCGGPGFTSGEAIIHTTTTDDGATWSEPDLVWYGAGGLAGVLQDKQWTARDPASGRIAVAWTSFQGAFNRAALSVSFSDDGGETWTTPEEIDFVAPNPYVENYDVHASWGADGMLHLSAHGCRAQTVPFADLGLCVLHFVGNAGGPWSRTELPVSDCPGLGAGHVGYAVGLARADTGLVVAGAEILDEEDAPLGVCLRATLDGGATWGDPVVVGARGNHPWLAAAPAGGIAVAYLELADGLATPTLALLDGETLAPLSSWVIGAPYDPDTDDDGALEYGDYDVLATHEAGWLWALTAPNPAGPDAPEGHKDMDIFAYRGAFLAP